MGKIQDGKYPVSTCKSDSNIIYDDLWDKKERAVMAGIEMWKFFDEMNELVYAADMDTHELLYMNKKALKLYGLQLTEQLAGRKCYEVMQNASAPCAICNGRELSEGYFKEWRYYNPVLNKYLMVKDTMQQIDGRRVRVEIAIDVSAENQQKNMVHNYQHLESLINEALRIALQAPDLENSLKIVLEYLGKALDGERAYIFEKNEKGGDDNTYEWVANGVTPQKDNLQNVPPEVCAGWYRIFYEDKCVVIDDIEKIRTKDTLVYETLKQQSVSSIVVVPLYSDGKVIGFYGVDNPPVEALGYISNMLQIMGHFIESLLKMRNLVRNLQAMSYSDQMTQFGNRYAMKEYLENIRPERSIGVVYGDITGLKRVNDEAGHEAGDRLILSVCRCMREAFDDSYTLFRIGGDELLAISEGIGETEFGEQVEKMKAYMKEYAVNMSVGAVWRNDAAEGVQSIMTEAEKLMYKDKASYYAAAGINRRK